MSLTPIFIQAFKRRVFDESYKRIFICLDLLTQEQIWYSPNQSTNSIGNLILHLIGNAQQWIVGSFGNDKISRNRSAEFVPKQNIPKNELKNMLVVLKSEMLPLIENLSNSDLNNTYNVQVYNEQGIDIIIHVIEHFSYHTGQIALLTKLIADKSLNFYDYPLE
jgi:uncharacterized damage-inducible protein DinB